MNNGIQFEDRVSRSRSKHEGEPSADICDRLSRTRVSSQRQLPTDHDYAVPTREYQLDQSSPLPASAAADPVLEIQKQKPPHRFEDVDRVTPYQCPVSRFYGQVKEQLVNRSRLMNTDPLSMSVSAPEIWHQSGTPPNLATWRLRGRVPCLFGQFRGISRTPEF
jgi:hypothetical protein